MRCVVLVFAVGTAGCEKSPTFPATSLTPSTPVPPAAVQFSLTGLVQHFSGKPWAATAQIALPQGDQRILLEPRGSRRLSSQTLLDLRLSRPISFGSFMRVELLVDVLNVLSDAAEEGIATALERPHLHPVQN